jgi:DNA polymerase-1
VKTFYVVDGHSHLFRAYHAVGYLSTSKGVPSHAVLILSTMLWKLVREEKPDYLASRGTRRGRRSATRCTRSTRPPAPGCPTT